ncbi:hypothetical protein [uncultured Sulfitobacter sp.]|uniref:hypothetical protein n=1 Tax=uncultured Sulfitobacter sp. TaxID=191468 RepID=UPI0026269AEC|nr:hypothetical protein [uncultured Sulfitobacter sp.]
MRTFAQNLMKLAPDWVTLPPELVEVLNWLDIVQGNQIIRGDAPRNCSLSIMTLGYWGHPTRSYFHFGKATPASDGIWSDTSIGFGDRLFEIAETSSDGGRIAIWLDEEGKQQYVHIGHKTLGVITDDPVVFLQFIAMGYPEPGSLMRTDITPVAAYLEHRGLVRLEDFRPDEQPVYPVALQGFLKERFDLDMPATARDLGITDFPEYGDDSTNDPFARWINEATPETSEADLVYEMELMRTIEALNLQDDDSSDTIMGKIGSLFKSKDNRE